MLWVSYVITVMKGSLLWVNWWCPVLSAMVSICRTLQFIILWSHICTQKRPWLHLHYQSILLPIYGKIKLKIKLLVWRSILHEDRLVRRGKFLHILEKANSTKYSGSDTTHRLYIKQPHMPSASLGNGSTLREHWWWHQEVDVQQDPGHDFLSNQKVVYITIKII